MVDNSDESDRASIPADPYDLVIAGLRKQKQEHEAKALEYEAKAKEERDQAEAVEHAIQTICQARPPVQSVTTASVDGSAVSPGTMDAPASETMPSADEKPETPPQSSSKETVAIDDWRAIPPDILRSICYGRGIADAGMAILTFTNKPLSEDELTEALTAGGVTFVGSDPINSFRFAMMRKQRDTKTVFEKPPRVWNLASWKEDTGFVSHRSRTEHMAASLKGLQAAKERGVKLGAKPKVTEEHAPQITELLAEKISMADLAKRFDMSIPGMMKAVARLRDQGLVPGGPIKRRGRRGGRSATQEAAH